MFSNIPTGSQFASLTALWMDSSTYQGNFAKFDLKKKTHLVPYFACGSVWLYYPLIRAAAMAELPRIPIQWELSKTGAKD